VSSCFLDIACTQRQIRFSIYLPRGVNQDGQPIALIITATLGSYYYGEAVLLASELGKVSVSFAPLQSK
jgi:hypothetical protein